MLCAIVVIHELGHLIAAKAFGVYCYEFSIGMGPKLWMKKGKETNICIRAFPIGGFVAMAGEDDQNPDVDKPNIEIPKERTLKGIHPIKRIVIMSAGVIMNFVLAICLMAVCYMSIGYATKSPEPIIDSVKIDYPAYKAGLEKGDRVLRATIEDTGYSISPKNFEELSTFFNMYEGKGNIALSIERDSKQQLIKVKPVLDEGEGRYVIGITSPASEIVEVNFLNSFKYACDYLFEITKFVFITLVGLFRGVGFNNLSGPIGIYEVTEEAVSYGLISYVSLIAMISVNVGAFNLVPLPIFDGGRIVLTIIEMIIKKPIDKKVENAIMSVSLGLLLLLVIYTSYKDIIRLMF